MIITVVVVALLLCGLWWAVHKLSAPIWLFYGAAIVVAVLLLLALVGGVPYLSGPVVWRS